MVAPVVIAAYKERETIIKAVVYGIAAIAIMYAAWKLFGKFKSIGEAIDKNVVEPVKNVVKGIQEGIDEAVTYGWTITPDETAEIIAKRAKGKDEYLIPESTYQALKEQGYELPENVKPYDFEESIKESKIPVYRETSTVGSKLGLWMPKGKEIPQPMPGDKGIEELMEIEGKRWEARAKTYEELLRRKLAEKRLGGVEETPRKPMPVRTTPIYAI